MSETTASTAAAKPVTAMDLVRMRDLIRDMEPPPPSVINVTQAEYDQLVAEVRLPLGSVAQETWINGVRIVVKSDAIRLERELSHLWSPGIKDILDPDYFEKDAARRGVTLY